MKDWVMPQFDTPDGLQMYEYLESRIDALQRRIVELEAENAALRCNGFTSLKLPFMPSV
jgi:hypothetical protein